MSAEAGRNTWESAVVWLRNQPDRRQLVLDAYYDDPLPAAAKRYHQSDEWREIAARLRGRSGKALDVGAGRGIASYALAREGFAVTALEPDPSTVVPSVSAYIQGNLTVASGSVITSGNGISNSSLTCLHCIPVQACPRSHFRLNNSW